MKTSITIWAVDNGVTGFRDIVEAALVVKEAGFDALEISMCKKGQISLGTSINELKVLRQDIANANVCVSSMSTLLLNEYSLAADDLEERKSAINIVLKMLESATILGLKNISISPGMVTQDVSYKSAYYRSLESIRRLGERAKQLGVVLCLENVWQGLLLSPLEFAKYIDEIDNEYVKICFDTGNSMNTGFPQHWIEILDNRIEKIHITDIRKRKGNILEFVCPGCGEIRWDKVLNAIKEIDYDGFFTIEAFYNKRKNEIQELKNLSLNLQKIMELM